MGTFSVEVDVRSPAASADGLTLLGAHALEGLGLVVDPVRRVLEPGRFPLA